MSLFQKRSGSPFPMPPVAPFPGVSMFGGQTPDQAMRIAAVWSCVRLLAETVSMMPLHAFTMREGVRVPLPDPQLIRSPQAWGTMQDWLYQCMVSLLLRGNAYGLVSSRDGNGYPRSIQILNPDTVSITENRDGTVVYRVNGIETDNNEIFHLRAFLMPGSRVGLSPIKYAAQTLTTLSAAEAFGSSFFVDGAHPSSLLMSDQPISEDNAAKIKARFLAAINGREPAVMGAGVKWQPVQISPEESQFLATQEFGLAQIARIFGVPGELLGISAAGGSITYANVTQRAMDFLTYGVQGWLTRFEQALFPLLPGERHVRFDTSALVRLDPESKARVDTEHLNTGSRTINDVRAEDNYGPVPWGDKPYLPTVKTTAAGVALQVGDQPGSGKADLPATDNSTSEDGGGAS